MLNEADPGLLATRDSKNLNLTTSGLIGFEESNDESSHVIINGKSF